MDRPDIPIRIALLADHPECLPTLVRWFEDEWQPHYGPHGEGSAEHDLNECCRRDALPLALVAMNEDADPVATAALRQSSVGAQPGEGPWLAALLVAPQYRRHGIATALVTAIGDEALARGFDRLFTSTDAEAFVSGQSGWQALRQETSLRGPITVYSKSLENPHPEDRV